MRLDPLRMAVAALALGPNIALAPFLSPPPDRARRADPKSLSRRSTRQSALNLDGVPDDAGVFEWKLISLKARILPEQTPTSRR